MDKNRGLPSFIVFEFVTKYMIGESNGIYIDEYILFCTYSLV